MSDFPYAGRFPVNRRLPERGRPREEVLAELRTMAAEEDATWETGKCSGTMYSGDHDHYRYLNEVFGLFAHVNVLQRDMCPSATKFEGEVIAMALDLMHADAVEGTTPAGLVTSGGTDSILHAMLSYREHAAQHRGIDGSSGRPNIVKPETAHPAFDKAAHLLGLELRVVPVTEDTTVDPAAVAERIDERTIGIIGSACNYGYGTIDPIADLGRLALERDVPLHVDGCLGGFILPFGEQLGYDVPPFDFRVPGVTTISADTHKYGYSFKGTSTLLFRDKAYRNAQYFQLVGWSGGKYMSPSIAGSRSGGLLAATWASMVEYGREGYLEHARAIFSTAERMKAAVRSHPELRILGSPTFCFSFTSDEFDIYHVADLMRERGWRFNGQQYPNAIHMAVTGPQTRPGVVEQFEADLAEAVPYAVAKAAAGEDAFSGAIYGGVVGGLTDEVADFVGAIMTDMLDTQQSLPPEEG
ncbi:pyridoxal phosphate-dependent decarboxylase family protein [Nocardioides sp.]|uniref:pyridoxal phosphate-dependent decarboxylase family protein n=1 Tax=Nocardioides sp. TaxID=35761 RepID=UPI0037837704